MKFEMLLVLLIVGVLLGAGVVAFAVVCDVLFPRLVGRSRDFIVRSPVRSFVVGVVNFVFFALLAVAFLSRGDGASVIGLVIATVVVGGVLVGVTALGRLIGERLCDDGGGLRRQVVVGVVVFEVSLLAPLVGWFGVSLVGGLVGFGAVIGALVNRDRSQDGV